MVNFSISDFTAKIASLAADRRQCAASIKGAQAKLANLNGMAADKRAPFAAELASLPADISALEKRLRDIDADIMTAVTPPSFMRASLQYVSAIRPVGGLSLEIAEHISQFFLIIANGRSYDVVFNDDRHDIMHSSLPFSGNSNGLIDMLSGIALCFPLEGLPGKKHSLWEAMKLGVLKTKAARYITFKPSPDGYSEPVIQDGEWGESVYNTWRGIRFPAWKTQGEISIEKQHIVDDYLYGNVLCNLCGNNDKSFQKLMEWSARKILHPEQRLHCWVAFYGEGRRGKDFFAETVGKFFCPENFVVIDDSSSLFGNFNAFLKSATVVSLQEACFAKDKEKTSQLKGIITKDYALIEAKFRDAQMQQVYYDGIMSANEQQIIDADTGGEHRFLAINIGEKALDKAKNDAIIAAFAPLRDDPEAMNYLLQKIVEEAGEVDYSKKIEIAGIGDMEEQKEMSEPPMVQAIKYIAENGVRGVTAGGDIEGGAKNLTDANGFKMSRVVEWIRYVERKNFGFRGAVDSPAEVKAFVKRVFAPERKQKTDKGVRDWRYVFGNRGELLDKMKRANIVFSDEDADEYFRPIEDGAEFNQ